MPVSVEIPTILRTYTGGQKSVQASGSSLAELLADLDTRYPGLRSRLLADDGKVLRFINVYINGRDVRADASLESKLSDGDVVSIIPAVAGGA
jgi:MoaD family protein